MINIVFRTAVVMPTTQPGASQQGAGLNGTRLSIKTVESRAGGAALRRFQQISWTPQGFSKMGP